MFNQQLKHFEILKQIFRNELWHHGDAMRAVAVITQITINQGERLLACGYRDPPYDVDGGALSTVNGVRIAG